MRWAEYYQLQAWFPTQLLDAQNRVFEAREQGAYAPAPVGAKFPDKGLLEMCVEAEEKCRAGMAQIMSEKLEPPDSALGLAQRVWRRLHENEREINEHIQKG